jgi:hypothetical protein
LDISSPSLTSYSGRPRTGSNVLSRSASAMHQQESAPLTASERILAAEMRCRGEASDALSMMVSSVARMVQVGKSCDSRWKSS